MECSVAVRRDLSTELWRNGQKAESRACVGEEAYEKGNYHRVVSEQIALK